MGSAIGRRLVQAGCIVLTNLNGRSDATRRRAEEAGMRDASYTEMARKARWILSVLPPKDAKTFATTFLEQAAGRDKSLPLAFADCNAISPRSVKEIAALFDGSGISFIDAGIIGLPNNPKIYASAEDNDVLEQFASLNKHGLNIETLKGPGVGIGDASALKMSYAGMTKGVIGVFTTMILAAHGSSPATADALLRELHASQPMFVERITKVVPGMMPKAYRWVGEMREIKEFVGEGEGEIYEGLARLYERIEKSINEQSEDGDIAALKDFVSKAKDIMKE
ncbi:6-phosphogluconate dehydrogenase C-terminal domain-like protein [Fistulina hepatica ATCC 64428]|uniref:6-phosphogluconate dehydrogenase C-terminal domain-like protein n=1 Tax=Fistulina hepatica ATCC 64428 TaxID=1128425 RepID=A0A0D7AHS2_9AGAR|nr:6-phosphogluconate dehydrogenase C-terminal domain-like protein [Fistulina hepatica ATCC 64428]